MSYSVDSVFKAIHSVADLGEGPGRPAPPPSPYFGAKSIYVGSNVSFLTGTDQLPKLEMSTNFEFELNMNNKSGFPSPSLLVKDLFFFFSKRVSDGTSSFVT